MRASHTALSLAAACLAAASILPAVATAASTGGASAEGSAASTVRCVESAEFPCPAPRTAIPGGELKVRGRELSEVRTVVFRGGRGRRDDIVARARHSGPTHAEAIVPDQARSGRLELRLKRGRRILTPRVRVEEPTPASTPALPPGSFVFPIRGRHDLGQSATNDFGGARNHKGQDMFAKCGTPLAVVEAGTVRVAKNEGAAGNHAVITGASTGRDYVYMHMREAAMVNAGDKVAAGQPLGYVGETGNASGCHLHFERWSAPGWYAGGAAGNPLSDLKAWDAQDRPHKH